MQHSGSSSSVNRERPYRPRANTSHSRLPARFQRKRFSVSDLIAREDLTAREASSIHAWLAGER